MSREHPFPKIRMIGKNDCVRGVYVNTVVKLKSEQYSALRALYGKGGIAILSNFKPRTIKGLKNNHFIKIASRKMLISERLSLPEYYIEFVNKHPLATLFYYIPSLKGIKGYIKSAKSDMLYKKKLERGNRIRARKREIFLKKENKRKAAEQRRGERREKIMLKREMKRLEHITKIF